MTTQISLFDVADDNGAIFSDDRKYRYALWRKWDKSKGFVMFIGLNPSKADEDEDDRTIARVTSFSKKWGFGGFYMTNLFAHITPYPEELVRCVFNSRNDSVLKEVRSVCSEVVFAYGNFKASQHRVKEIHEMFPEGKALLLNKNGTPRHPLYIKGDCELKPFIYKPIL